MLLNDESTESICRLRLQSFYTATASNSLPPAHNAQLFDRCFIQYGCDIAIAPVG